MEKIVIEFVPDLKDYSRAVRSFYTHRRSYWIRLGVMVAFAIIILPFSFFKLLTGDLRTGLYFIPLLLLFAFLASYPLWVAWLTIRSASKKENLTLPTKYEFGDEKVFVFSPIAEANYDWSMFSSAFEDRQYYFIIYSTNKNMCQFIPKRAFTSLEQEAITRKLIVRHLGKIEDTRSGLTGWTLAALTAILAFVVVLCIIGLTILVNSI